MTDGSQVQTAAATRPVQRTEDEPESRLVEEAKSNPQAFGLLYERYVERIYNYIFYRTGNQQEAEDLTAKVFHKALDHIGRYDNRGVPFSAWLYRIARNEALSRLRRQKWLSPQSWFGATEMRVTETAVQTRQTRQSIHHALARLRPQDRDIIVLRYLEELPSDQVAEILDCSTQNVYVRLHRALERLRTELESEPPAPTKDFTKVAPLNE